MKDASCVRVKICGITRGRDALEAVRLGADALGFVFAESSRKISPEKVRDILKELPPLVMTVGVFMDQSPDEVSDCVRKSGVGSIQLHGHEDERLFLGLNHPILRRIDLHEYTRPDMIGDRIRYLRQLGCGILFDPGAGDGRPFEWSRIRGVKEPFVLAGGLRPDNIREALRMTRPWAVDVSSGVESEPGIKDSMKMNAFIREVRC